jgi:uncharacterized protein
VKISGTTTLHAPPPQAWAALNDPAVLIHTIPGCEHLEPVGQDTYRLTITARVASIQGTYTGEVSLTDRQNPTSLQLSLNVAGAPGTLTASARVQLAPTPDGSAELTYDADAIPDGAIAAVGHRLLASAAKKLASDFFAAVDDVLMSRAAAVSAPDGVGEPRPPQGVRTGGAAGVASPAVAATQGASGLTGEPPTADRQPAGRPRARPPTESFLQGVLVGAGIVLAGMIVGRLLGRRSR